MKNLLLLISLVLLALSDAQAQKSYKKYPLQLTTGNHAISMPFYRVLRKPYHPALSIGTQLTYKRGTHGQLFQAFNLGGFYNKYTATGLLAQTELGYRYYTKAGLFADAFLGIGYLHIFQTREVFKQKNDAEYEKAKDFGRPSATGSFSLGMGYDFSRQAKLPLALFARYQWLAQTPYGGGLPILPQSIISIGTRIYFVKP
jgi:opacity protein-like surface antigen